MVCLIDLLLLDSFISFSSEDFPLFGLDSLSLVEVFSLASFTCSYNIFILLDVSSSDSFPFFSLITTRNTFSLDSLFFKCSLGLL